MDATLLLNTKCISTTELCKRLGLVVSVKFLMNRGAMPASMTANGVLWDENDYLEVCGLLADYFTNGGAMYE